MQAPERIREVLEMIVCPACHGQLTFDAGCVRCAACSRRYPIEDGIPVLLEARAEVKP